MDSTDWHDLGPAEQFTRQPVSEAMVGRLKIAVSYLNGEFGAVSGTCNHVGGPLGQGTLDGEYLVCPWHYWKFHRKTGLGEPGYEKDAVPSHEVKVEGGHLWVRGKASTPRSRIPHDPHPLTRPVVRADGPVRVAGISTTAMDAEHPRYSTSEALLDVSLEHARAALGCETKLIRLRDLQFRACEGFYSRSAHACTWPCSLTQKFADDQMTEVYEALVHWADVVLIATPIRWGAASSLFFKMAERLNCVQNQITIRDNVLIRNKVAAFIITGGQDNVQAVAGQSMQFFAELGFNFPQFPYIAHSLGWSSENMERNIAHVQESAELREGAQALIKRGVDFAQVLIAHQAASKKTVRGGRKAHKLDVQA